MSGHPLKMLVPYLRGELDRDEQAQVAQHLHECAACRREIDALGDTSKLVARRLHELTPPDPLAYRAELRRKLAVRSNTTRDAWWKRGLVWLPLAGGAVAMAVLLTIVMRSRPSIPSMEQIATENEMANTDIGLLRNYPVIAHLQLLENYDVIEHLDELHPAGNKDDAAPL